MRKINISISFTFLWCLIKHTHTHTHTQAPPSTFWLWSSGWLPIHSKSGWSKVCQMTNRIIWSRCFTASSFPFHITGATWPRESLTTSCLWFLLLQRSPRGTFSWDSSSNTGELYSPTLHFSISINSPALH
jgi:hypothetical protein